MYDILAGTAFVVGLKEDDFASLSPELAQKYVALFKSPEQFFQIDGKLIGLKTNPENMTQAIDELMSKLTSSAPPEAPMQQPKLSMGG